MKQYKKIVGQWLFYLGFYLVKSNFEVLDNYYFNMLLTAMLLNNNNTWYYLSFVRATNLEFECGQKHCNYFIEESIKDNNF